MKTKMLLFAVAASAGIVFTPPSATAQQIYTLTTLHSFGGGADGANPQAPLIQGSDGNFYGTTAGGLEEPGTVFTITPSGTFTNLYNFTGLVDGTKPYAGLVQGSDGNFYGTTKLGGVNSEGTVFKITPSGTLTYLHNFGAIGGPADDGNEPCGALIQGSDGNLYGTTYYGGAEDDGCIFIITLSGNYTNLYSCPAVQGPANPTDQLIQGIDGNFYGTTYDGGPSVFGYSAGGGTIFRMIPSGVLTVLTNFPGGSSCGWPYAGLVQGTDGNFYGTTTGGSAGPLGPGTVFKITPSGTLTTLYNFTGTVNYTGSVDFTGGVDGSQPYGALVQGSDGNFYGTTSTGGTNNAGTVFKITPSGTLTKLYDFTGGVDGGQPMAGLIRGSDGNFYGTTSTGGANGNGSVFKISVTLAAPPFINVQPQSQSVAAGSNATFNVTATGYTPLTIQWFNGASQVLNGGRFQIVNGADVGGVDTSTLTISNVITSDDGNYYVVVTNVAGSITSSNANLTVTTPAITTNTLTVASSNPGSGVSITVSPNDTGGNGNGNTPFTRNYTNNTQVTLTAPSTAGGNNFQKWQQNGADYSNNRSAAITMNANYTITAVYTNAPAATYTLTVTSSNPNSGVSITASPNDNFGQGGGTTPFTLTYNSGTVVTLTAPSTAGGNNFYLWQQDGATWVCCGNAARSTYFTMNGSHTMTAVYGGISIIALSGNLSFGTVQAGASAVRTFTIQSQGGYQPLHVSGITYNSPGFSGSWSGTIPIDGSTNVTVTFSPTTNGFYSGVATVNSDATLGSNSIPISGTGVVAPPPPPVTPFPVAAFSVIYSFPYQSSLSGPWAFGANPEAGLVQGADGDFYGSTIYGGSLGYGVIFRMNAAGSNQLLYAFPAGDSNGGGYPVAPLMQASNGILYGTAKRGGGSGRSLGSIFSITTNGQFTTLYPFTDANNGGYFPEAALIQATDGNLYGTASGGGNGCGGTAFKITTSGTFTELNDFDCSISWVASRPTAPLVQGKDGNFYGTAFAYGANNAGNIFKMNSSGVLSNLYSFTGGNDGGHPCAGLVLATDGYFYGVTPRGGAYGYGTIFKVTTNGVLTVLHSFTGGIDGDPGTDLAGNYPLASLIQATDGNLYGTTYAGGAYGVGIVFQITTNGVFTTLHSFSGTDGSNPLDGLVQGRDGNLYGTTWQGGTDGGGTVFRLVIPPGTLSVTITGGVLNINWKAVPGQTYQVQYSTDLRQTDWMVLISAVTPTNSTATAIDSVGPDSQRFYRIVEYPEAW